MSTTNDTWWTLPKYLEDRTAFDAKAVEEAAKKDTMTTTYEAPWTNKRRKATPTTKTLSEPPLHP